VEGTVFRQRAVVEIKDGFQAGWSWRGQFSDRAVMERMAFQTEGDH